MIIHIYFQPFLLLLVDANRVVKREKLAFQGCDLTVTSFIQKPMVKITGVTKKIPNEALEMFFENPRKSGGGDIEKLDVILSKQMAIITYEDQKGNILKQTHFQEPLPSLFYRILSIFHTFSRFYSSC